MPHPWPVFPPEENYTALTSGTGPATTLAYADAFVAEAANLQAVMGTSVATAAGTYATGWQGLGAASATQTGLNTQHELLVGWVMEKPPLVAAAASAHQTAAATMVTAEQAVANRMEEAADEQINPWVWGALTPRIVALNLDYYGHMWPRNAGAGAAYGAALAENGAMSAAGAAMQATEQAAQAVVAPAVAAPEAGAMLGAVPLAAPASPAVSSGAAPLAAAQAPAQAVSGAPQSPAGMFARLSQAAVVPAPTGDAVPVSQVGEALTTRAGTLAGPASGPGGGGVSGYPGAGLTSYVRPANGFAPPTAGRATGARPGMLNAAQLRGPTTSSTATLLPSAQPLAHIQPHPSPRPTPPPQLTDPKQALHTQPRQSVPQTPQAQVLVPPAPVAPGSVSPPTPPAPPQSGPPAPSAPGVGPGAGAAGNQMLGFGPGQAPLAPPGPSPIPLDPAPPIPPVDPRDMTEAAARAAYEELKEDLARYGDRCLQRPFVLPQEQAAFNACVADMGALNARKAALEARLRELGVELEPAPPPAHGPPGATGGTPPFPPPTEITGLTKHGAERVYARDGHGVNDSALQDAVANPTQPPVFELDEYGRGSYRYVGKDAEVVLSKDGQVVTAWATGRNGWRNP